MYCENRTHTNASAPRRVGGERPPLRRSRPRVEAWSIPLDSHHGGFSLMEIMVVLVIIGLLAGVVALNVTNYLSTAERNTARMEIATISDALDTFYMVYRRYPTNEEGLAVLVQPTDQLPEPLLDQRPVDPWDNPYQYNRPGRDGPYEVLTLGADGREGGEGADQDIGSWDLKDGDGGEGVRDTR